MISNTPKPPYYAVIFTTILNNVTLEYEQKAKQMVELASQQDGFLGVESVRDEMGITVSYWKSMEAIQKWGQHPLHMEAKALGKDTFYKQFTTRICKVEREY